MKILMVNNRLKIYGGEGTYMTSVGDELIRIGHDVQYFGLADENKLHGNRYGIYAKKRRNPLSIFKSNYNKKQFSKLLDLFQPDIIHLNLIYYTLTPYILLEAKKRNIPVVQTIHDSKMVCPSYQLYDYDLSKPCSSCIDGNFKRCLKKKCVKNSKILSFLAYKEQLYNAKKNYYNIIDKFIFPSNFMKQLHTSFGIEEDKCVVLQNFSRFPRNNLIAEKKDYYIYFGRVTELKGMKVLADAARKLPNIKFYIVGDGESASLFENLNNCALFGFKNNEELIKLVSNARASIYPSILLENCPMSVAESIILGTPVICSNIGGIPEMFSNGKNGLLFTANDSEDLVRTILKVENDDLFNKLRSNCLNYTTKDICGYVDSLLSIYSSVMQKKY